MGFAFSTATSNATIPMSIDTLHRKMGVSRRISSFTIPLGATINMDGTAIMQGVAVVFASQAFGIHLSVADYLTVILTATLASVGNSRCAGGGADYPFHGICLSGPACGGHSPDYGELTVYWI